MSEPHYRHDRTAGWQDAARSRRGPGCMVRETDGDAEWVAAVALVADHGF